MNHRIRSVRENYNKTSTVLAVAAIAAVLSSTVAIGSGHIALAYTNKFTRVFSNSGNNQETYQDCGNSCTVISSNIISRGSMVPSVGTTSPTLSTIPAVPTLTVSGNYSNGIVTVAGRLYDERRNLGLGGQTLTVTITYFATTQPTTDTQTTMTDSNGDYVVSFPPIPVPPIPGTVISVTAEYGGGLIIGNIIYVEVNNGNVIRGPF
jgi:hypothetical protein